MSRISEYGRPNIVFILADDMGYGDVSCLNTESRIKTKHIDRMAAQGMKFTDAHASSSVCTPSRYGLLTGRYCWRTTMKSGVLWGYSTPLISGERTTVASLLKGEGYDTACFGKWHLGMTFPSQDGDPATGDETGSNVDWKSPIQDGPCSSGFDRFFGISASLDMPPYIFIEDDRFVGIPDEIKSFLEPNRPGPATQEFEAVDVLPAITNRAVEYISDHAGSDTPFFLYLPLNAPHTPLVPTDEFRGKSGLNDYADFCLQVDATVGQITGALEQSGLTENTLVIFASDNGCSPMADFGFLHQHQHRPSHHFRGHKADIYEGGHRIPFVAQYPRVVTAGTTCSETICMTDFLSTVADIVGASLSANAGTDSISLLPLLVAGGSGQPFRRGPTVHHSISGMFSIREGGWKLEFCPGSGGWSDPVDEVARERGFPPFQLYDLDSDIGEQNNLYNERPDIVTDLSDRITRIVKEGRSTVGPILANDGPQRWEQVNWY